MAPARTRHAARALPSCMIRPADVRTRRARTYGVPSSKSWDRTPSRPRHAKPGSADDSAKRFAPPFAAVTTADRANACLDDHAKLRSRREEREFFAEWDRQGWEQEPAPGPRLELTSDEIEVARDVLWFVVELNNGMARRQRSLWDRLQPVRHDDYGGTRSVVLAPEEAGALAQALDAFAGKVPLDPDERRLRGRLRG
jgi:hypothetical protein